MPIDLTIVPEGGGGSRHHRRRRQHRKHRHRRQVGFAIGGGLLALVLFGLGVYYLNRINLTPMPVVSNVDGNRTRMDPSTVEGDPLPVAKGGNSATVSSAPAVSSGELLPSVARAKVLSIRRVIAADGTSDLEVSYEFLALARNPSEYVIAIRSPRQIARAAFGKDATRSDVIRLGNTLKRIGSAGPIDVWIETIAPANERISNVMTIP